MLRWSTGSFLQAKYDVMKRSRCARSAGSVSRSRAAALRPTARSRFGISFLDLLRNEIRNIRVADKKRVVEPDVRIALDDGGCTTTRIVGIDQCHAVADNIGKLNGSIAGARADAGQLVVDPSLGKTAAALVTPTSPDASVAATIAIRLTPFALT